MRFVLAVLLMLPSFLGSAAPQQYIARYWQTEDGLPHNYILALAQTRDGYLWVGTRAGLARFDGVRFTPVDLGTNKGTAVLALCEGKDGSLWVALEGNGVVRWQSQDVAPYNLTNGLKSNFPRAMCAGTDGSVWFATRAGLTRHRENQFQYFTQDNGLAGLLTETVCEDAAGDIWVGTSGGLNRIRNGVISGTFTVREGLPGNSVTSLCADRHGNLWVGTSEGLARLRDGQVRATYNEPDGLVDRFIRTLYEDRQGNLWVGTYGGLYRLRNDAPTEPVSSGKPRFQPQLNSQGEAYDRVMAVLEDTEGNIWVGSRDGLNRLRNKVIGGFGKQQGLSQNSVTAVCEDTGGALWVATWRGGLDRLVDGKPTAYSVGSGLKTDMLLSLCPSRDGSLWIGTDHDGGLYRLREGKFTHYDARHGLTNQAIFALHEDRQTNLWIGTGKTLSRLADGKFINFTPLDGLVGDTVRAIVQDKQDRVWVGTSAGLSRWENGTFTNFTMQNGLPHDSIVSLYEDAGTNLWIGTGGGGLVRYREGRFTAYTTRNGLFSDDVLEILEDDAGCLWMSCMNGIYRVEKQSLDDFDAGKISAIPCASFGKDEGLAGLQCTSAAKPAGWKSKDGRLWFTTIKGLAVVAPNTKNNPAPPPVFIEEIFADKQRILPQSRKNPSEKRTALAAASAFKADSAIQIPPGRGELEFRYTALSYQSPEKNRFKYKLEGVDEDWVDATTRRVAYYNRVSPGEYRFRVLAANNNGVWNETGAVVTVVVHPHWWQNWWVIGAGVVLCVGAVGGVAAYWARKAARRRLERLQQQHALEKERARIARDIHDDLGSSLTRISMLSELAEADKAHPEEVETHVRKIAAVGSSRVDLQACKLEYSIVSPK